MKISNLKQDKGVAGLTILLSLVVMLFVIGILVMIFVLMGSRMQDALGDTAGENQSKDVINTTANAISSVTDWFEIFIVIAAMVVLILLTIIIITAIRSSGMIAQGSA